MTDIPSEEAYDLDELIALLRSGEHHSFPKAFLTLALEIQALSDGLERTALEMYCLARNAREERENGEQQPRKARAVRPRRND